MDYLLVLTENNFYEFHILKAWYVCVIIFPNFGSNLNYEYWSVQFTKTMMNLHVYNVCSVYEQQCYFYENDIFDLTRLGNT